MPGLAGHGEISVNVMRGEGSLSNEAEGLVLRRIDEKVDRLIEDVGDLKRRLDLTETA
jgi:hypothetical protein